MSLIRWDPFRGFNALPARFGGLFGKDWEASLSTTAWPLVDIFENDVGSKKRRKKRTITESSVSLGFSAGRSLSPPPLTG